MASTSGVGSASSTLSGLRGYGGLASGLDRDELIQSMTAGTRSKIAAKKQAQDKLGWQQDAMRNITTKMYQLTNKYTSYTSSSNLIGAKLFSRNSISALGANSKFIGVSGTASGASTISVLGVRQMAKNAQLTTLQNASSSKISTADVAYNLDTKTDVNLVSGEKIYIQYGESSYTINLKDKTGHDYDTMQDTADAINKALKEVNIGDDKTLADSMKAEVSASGTLVLTKDASDKTGNTIKLQGGTSDVLKNLGFLREGEDINELADYRVEVTTEGLEGRMPTKLIEQQSIAKQLGGKSISFSYNGKIEWIEMPSEKDLKGKTMKELQESMQEKLDDTFGTGRIAVNLTQKTDASGEVTGSLSFSTTKPKTDASGKVVPGDPDTSSVLTITSAEKGVIGNTGVFKMEEGVSNRLNQSTTLKNSGLVGIETLGSDPKLTINGVEIEITEEDSISSIMDKINSSKAGVNVTYQPNTDRFILSSTRAGASGQIQLEGNFADIMFGQNGTGYKAEKGQDAVIAVKYPGSDEILEIERGSNTFTVDGLNITLKGQFGYTAGATDINGLDRTAEAVTFEAKVDSDNTTKVVKEMIEAYNEVLELINSEVNQKPNRNYAPLTDEQKAEMSDAQIEKWETEAKKGLFFNDTDLRGLADKLRFVLPTDDKAALSKMGITVSTDYSDHGKLVFDETKFKAALDEDPDAVMNAFTKDETKDAKGNTIDGGVMVKMKKIMDQYAGTTGSVKGILIERAGSIYAPTSILKNSMQKEMDSLDDVIERLTTQLKTEQDRYIKQFTSLETAISQMNSQSSWLSQFGGTA